MAQKSKDEKQIYEHYVKPVNIIDNFEEVYKLEHKLIRSYDELYNFYKNEFKPNTFFAWDTETTSLNAEQGVKTGDLVEGKIVGYSFTQDGHIGYYVPVSHPDYSLGYKSLKIFYAMICRSKLNLLYNCRFDMRFLEAMTPEKYNYTPELDEKIYKFDLSGIKYTDVQNTVWLADTNLAMPSLKKSEKHFLGWNPPTFSETIGDESNFGYLPAEQGYHYASLDALATYHLFFKTEKYYTEAGAAAKLDNDLLYPLMRLENTPINVDHDYLQSMRGDVLKHLEDLKKYLFETVGREYNINSGRELVTIFQQLGIDTGKRTKTGIMETNIKAIEGYVASHGDSEYLNKLVEYKKLLKFDNSYLEKMLEMSEAENVAKHPIRFCYFTNKVPTGRLASGTDGKNSYFSKLNFQCLKYDTRVITKNGIKQIKDIVTGDLVWDGSKYMPCIQLGSKTKELIKVSCGNGHYLEASKEHQVYAIKDNNVGWYKLGDLTCDDYIAINRKYENTDDIITTINKGNVYNPLGGIKCREIHIESSLYDFWFLCGYLVGDGYFLKYKDHYCGFGLHIPKLKEIAMERLKRGFNEVGIVPFEQVSTKKGYTPIKSLCTKSANLAEALIDMGFKCLAKNKCIPDVVFNLSPRQKLAFIDGMISTDDTIGTSICYKTTSQQLAYDLRDLLETIGYYSTITEYENSVYNIIIHDKYRFRSEISLTVSYKNESLHNTISTNKKCGLPYKYFNKLKYTTNNIMSNNLDELERLGYTEAVYGWKKISNIENIGEDIVYDLYVEESHRFTANGFIVHNSLPKPHSHNYHVHKATPEQIANGEDLCGYIFNDDPNGSLGLTEGQDPHLNVRKAFCPIDNDSVVVSVDMKAEELRLVANIYKEQTWIKAFNSGQDVHRSTACKIFGEENYCKEARKKAKCISGDSLLYTDMGIIKIRDINPNRIKGLPIDVDFNISTPEGVCRCSKFIYNGNKNTIKFNMNNGAMLEVTPDHLVRSDNKWVRADALCTGDYIDFEPVAINSNKYQVIDLSYISGAKLIFSKELSYYIGAILGDGNISRKNVYFTSEDYELIQYMSSIVKRYNLGEAHENVQKYTKTNNKPFIRLNCGPKKARDLCRDIGLIDDAGHKQFKVPDVVLKSPNDVKFAFIQGIFDTDGTISKYTGHKSNFSLDFCTKSSELAIGCMHILRSLGISCRVCKAYNKVYKRMYYKVKLRATSARRFLELGGFKCMHKQARLRDWCSKVSFIKEYKKHYMIESIEESNSDVYDLTIENESHSFLANGFVVHNCASFGILYGASAYGFHNQFPDMTLEECEEFIEKFKVALPSIEAGQKASIRYAKKNGFVKTYFGRPRRVKYYLNHPDRSMRSFGERTVKNTAVQGAAGDCLKLMIIRLWKELFSKYPEIKWVGSIHDEITYIIPKSILIDALKIIKKCQTIKLPDWPVQLDCDISIGKSFGELIPWFLDDETGELTPQLEEIKHEQTEENHENKVNEYDMLLDADEYDYLQ